MDDEVTKLMLETRNNTLPMYTNVSILGVAWFGQVQKYTPCLSKNRLDTISYLYSLRSCPYVS